MSVTCSILPSVVRSSGTDTVDWVCFPDVSGPEAGASLKSPRSGGQREVSRGVPPDPIIRVLCPKCHAFTGVIHDDRSPFDDRLTASARLEDLSSAPPSIARQPSQRVNVCAQLE